MWTESGGVTGIGYEGKTLESLIEDLKALAITTLVDVRLNAISRKRGFSKRALGAALEEAGIRYQHRPELGNARDNRAGFAEEWRTDAGRAARDHYTETLRETKASVAVDELAELACRERVALLCFEASELHCHRRETLAAIRARIDELVAA
jgi:uncharacterized protein (DUF488 family)